MGFFYTDCGHPIGTDGTAADLAAERSRIKTLQFERDMVTALETGEFMYRSSSLLSYDTQDALAAIAEEYPHPTAESIDNVHKAFRCQPHSQPFVLARRVNIHANRFHEANAVIERGAYWDGSPALTIKSPNRFPIEATNKPARYDEQPRKGNVFIRNDTLHKGIIDALRQLNIIGDVVRIVGDGRSQLYECPLPV